MLGLKSVLYQAVDMFFGLLDFLIFVRVILSWIPIGRGNPIIQLLYTLTEPILAPIRSLLDKSPLGGMMLDFSAVFALILLYFIRMLLLNFLIGY